MSRTVMTARYSRTALLAALLIFTAGVSVARAATPTGAKWSVSVLPSPTALIAGDESGDQAFIVSVTNTGGSAAEGTGAPIIISDSLPNGVTIHEIRAVDAYAGIPLSCDDATATCIDTTNVPPGDELRVELRVGLSATATASAPGLVTVSGGNTPEASAAELIAPPASVSFGVASFVASTASRQAGAHANFTTSFTLNSESLDNPVDSPKDIELDLPNGFVGDPLAVPQCPMVEVLSNTCPPDTAVGVAVASVANGSAAQAIAWDALVYSVPPNPNEPAALAFDFQFPIRIDTRVGVGADGSYRIRAVVSNTTEAAQLIGTSVTLWGNPSEFNAPGPIATTFGQTFGDPSDGVKAAFMSNPTSCSVSPLADLRLDPWQAPGAFTEPMLISLPTPIGCERLTFSPSLSISPDSSQASEPSGYGVELVFPQNENPEALATPALKDAKVQLPSGTVVSASAADGLEACSQTQIGFEHEDLQTHLDVFSPDAPSCPEASKIGTVEAETPLLNHPLHGSLFLARQNENPFNSLLAAYMVIEGPGILVKLPLKLEANLATGQLTTTVTNSPELPVSRLRLHLKGGARAALANPENCGEATATAALTPYSRSVPSIVTSSFNVDWDGHGAACPATRPFAPSFLAGTESNEAGGFGPFTMTFSRSDHDEQFGGLSVHLPQGLLGIIRNVEECPEPQAAKGACGPGSEVGTVTAGAGPGAHPYFVSGHAYLTGPYKSAPFGLSIVVPAKAGPYDFGDVVVRAQIAVDPNTAQIVITSDPFPTSLASATIPVGIPLQIRTINVDVNRPNFIFNPTDCEPLAIDATFASTGGNKAEESARYQAAGCQGLAFKPKFTASTPAKTSRTGGAGLTVRIAYPTTHGEANIHSVKVTLPKQLPARLSTIQHACTAATFEANPATCPAQSLIGIASGTTPVLAEPITGPVYLVSHGGEAFPDVVMVLEAQGIRVDLTGNINIAPKTNVTSSTFNTVPDVPITSFAISLPEGPHSALAAVLPAKAKGSMCGQNLTMPTTITAQNGMQIKQATKLTPIGCAKAKPTSKAKKKKKK